MTYISDSDQRRVRKKLRFWRVVGVLALIVIAITWIGGRGGWRGAHVARLTVEGVIVQNEARTRLLAELPDTRAVALIVHINSPGGTVVGGEDLFRSLETVATELPVVVVMGTLATSGGYMAALAGDRIFARESTITGSIGVLVQTTDFTGLLDRLGIVAEAVKSSALKAQPSPLEPMTEEGRAALQAVIDDMYGFFVDLVADRRNLDRARAVELADGRIYSGRQAVDAGLIDEIGGETAAIAWLAEARGLAADLPVVDIEIDDDRGLVARLIDRLTGNALLSNTLTLDGLVSLWQPEAQ